LTFELCIGLTAISHYSQSHWTALELMVSHLTVKLQMLLD